MSKVRIRGGNAWKKVILKIASNEPEVVIGVQAGAKTDDGELVAPYAFYNEFGATIKQKGREQLHHFRKLKNGQVRFTTKSKSEFTRTSKVGDYTIVIPPRPAFRNSIEKNYKKWRRIIRKGLEGNILKENVLFNVFDIAGRQAALDIQKEIKSSVPPPNAKSTVNAKKKKGRQFPTTTLVDEGYYFQSISHKVLNIRW